LEFCPKCGKLLIPDRRGEKTYLVCKSCGFEKLASESKGYKIVQTVEEGKRRKTLIVEEPAKIVKKRKEEERELMADYYELFLENYEETAEEESATEETEFE